MIIYTIFANGIVSLTKTKRSCKFCEWASLHKVTALTITSEDIRRLESQGKSSLHRREMCNDGTERQPQRERDQATTCFAHTAPLCRKSLQSCPRRIFGPRFVQLSAWQVNWLAVKELPGTWGIFLCRQKWFWVICPIVVWNTAPELKCTQAKVTFAQIEYFHVYSPVDMIKQQPYPPFFYHFSSFFAKYCKKEYVWK